MILGLGSGAPLPESRREFDAVGMPFARRGAKVYCEVAGWGQASDGHNVAISHPEGLGLRAAMENALTATEKASRLDSLGDLLQEPAHVGRLRQAGAKAKDAPTHRKPIIP